MENDFKLTRLKFTHFNFNSGFVYDGCPIKTSVELRLEYTDIETEKQIWKQNISHTYMLEKNFEEKTNYYEEQLKNPETIISLLEKINLKNLKNNYFSDDTHKFSHWELEYNDCFKIVGTYNNEIEEIKKVKEILDFETIVSKEMEKVKKELKI